MVLEKLERAKKELALMKRKAKALDWLEKHAEIWRAGHQIFIWNPTASNDHESLIAVVETEYPFD